LLAARHPRHVTFRVRRDVPALRTRRLLSELERSWREVRERARFRIVHYSVQGNHVHLPVEAASARDLASGLKSLGRASHARARPSCSCCGPHVAAANGLAPARTHPAE
jgi:REP element-mobilizing transposase RayT